MAMTLQQAIDYALAPTDPTPYGLDTWAAISMHEDSGAVMSANAGDSDITVRADLPLLNWGPATFRRDGLVGNWFRQPQVPGFSTRGLGGISLSHAGGGISVDLSVRRDPGRPPFNFLLGPSVQIEIERLSAAGAAIDGVTLNAGEDGTLCAPSAPACETMH